MSRRRSSKRPNGRRNNLPPVVRVSTKLPPREGVKTQTLTAIPIDDFIATFK